MPFLSVIDRTIWAILRNRWVGMVCVVAGLALTTLGLFADLIGPGSGSGFPGLRQQIAVVGGLFTIFVGAVSLSNQTDKLRTRLYNYVTGHGHVLYVPSRNTQLWIMTVVVLLISIPRFYSLTLRPL